MRLVSRAGEPLGGARLASFHILRVEAHGIVHEVAAQLVQRVVQVNHHEVEELQASDTIRELEVHLAHITHASLGVLRLEPFQLSLTNADLLGRRPGQLGNIDSIFHIYRSSGHGLHLSLNGQVCVCIP